MKAQSRAFHFVHSMLAYIEAENDFAQSARLGEWLARFLIKNHCGIYRLDILEERLLSKLPSPIATLSAPKGELHIATDVYANGGHTALMRSLVHQAKMPPDVLLTKGKNANLAGAFLQIHPDRVRIFDALPEEARVRTLAESIASYETIYMHIHPDDLMGALAISLAKRMNDNIKVAFVNHADHVFSVGMMAADRVLEISSYGWVLREKRKSNAMSSYIGIPIATPPRVSAEWRQKWALTGGSAFKFKPMNGKSLPGILRKLLTANPSLSVIAVGPGSRDHWWWPLRWRHPKRLRIIKSLPHGDYVSLLNQCSLYIDSYPWSGGTAFSEALMSGCCVAGLKDGARGYSHADVLRSDSVASFLLHCNALANGDPEALQAQEEVRQACIVFHAPSTVRERADTALQMDELVLPPDWLTNDPPDMVAEAAWARTGRPHATPIKGLGLNKASQNALLRLHRHHFGAFCQASLKLYFDARVKGVR